MNTLTSSAWFRALRPGTLLFGGGLVLFLISVVLAGGSLWELFLFWAAFVLCILGSGSFLLRKLMPRLSHADRLVLSFLPGCVLLFGSYLLFQMLFPLLPALALLPPGLLGIREVYLLVKDHAALRTAFSAEDHLVQQLRLGTWGIALFLYTFMGVFPFAEASALKAWSYHQDMLWSVGNAAAVSFGFPLHDMRAAGLTLHYHFFNDGIAGILSHCTGCTAWHGLCFYWYVPILLLSILGLERVARKLTGSPRLACLTAPLVYFCNPALSTMPFNLFTNANAQGTALLALSGLLLLVTQLPAKAPNRELVGYFLLGLFCFGSTCMIKSPMGALAILALAAACIVGAFTKKVRPSHLALLGGAAAAFGCVYLLVLRHATNNLVFTTLANLIQLPQAYRLYFALPLLLLYLGSLLYSLRHFKELSLTTLLVNAFSIGGMLAYVLYSHYSFSQVYFALSAVPCGVLAALPALQALGRWLKSHQPRLHSCGIGVLCVLLLLCFGVQLYGSRDSLRQGVQGLLRCAGLRESETTERTITDEDWEAATWLRENTAPDAVFLSNRNNKQFDAAEGVFHFFSAASQRQCYLESYRYAMDYDNAYHEIRRRLETISDAIYYRLPEADAFALAQSEQVDYILVSLLVPNAPNWDTPPVYENSLVRIYAVP